MEVKTFIADAFPNGLTSDFFIDDITGKILHSQNYINQNSNIINNTLLGC